MMTVQRWLYDLALWFAHVGQSPIELAMIALEDSDLSINRPHHLKKAYRYTKKLYRGTEQVRKRHSLEHILEEIAAMRSVPNMVPIDSYQAWRGQLTDALRYIEMVPDAAFTPGHECSIQNYLTPAIRIRADYGHKKRAIHGKY